MFVQVRLQSNKLRSTPSYLGPGVTSSFSLQDTRGWNTREACVKSLHDTDEEERWLQNNCTISVQSFWLFWNTRSPSCVHIGLILSLMIATIKLISDQCIGHYYVAMHMHYSNKITNILFVMLPQIHSQKMGGKFILHCWIVTICSFVNSLLTVSFSWNNNPGRQLQRSKGGETVVDVSGKITFICFTCILHQLIARTPPSNLFIKYFGLVEKNIDFSISSLFQWRQTFGSYSIAKHC